MSVTRSQQRVRPEVLTKMWVRFPHLPQQTAIANHLDNETTDIDDLIGHKQSLLDRLDERIEAMVSATIGESALVGHAGPTREIRRLLAKCRKPGNAGEQVVTAFRDGQVTARALRRAEGYTEAWTDNTAFQKVRRGDIVVHGLDGFAGAVGTSEADGICSPVYHVMEPLDGGEPDFYGRLLHVLATSGYLGLFAVSTRERAVDFRNWDLFGRIPIPAVSVERQAEIGARVRALRPLRSVVERSIALAMEHRQALITAAVMGDLEIPGVA
jgi:type I restriction enzyme S subunit